MLVAGRYPLEQCGPYRTTVILSYPPASFARSTNCVAGGRPGFYNFRPLRKVGLDGGYFFLGGTTASLNAFARRNFTTVLAGILMASPV